MNGFFNKTALKIVLAFFIIFFAYTFYRYITLAFTPPGKISSRSQTVERGSIVDRSGKPLAVQTNFYHVGVTPNRIKNNEQFAEDIAPYLEMTKEDLLRILQRAENSSFVYLKKKIDQNTYTELKKVTNEKNYLFVSFDRIPGRVYPENALASQLIGYMGDDGKGLAGIEYSMQEELQPPVEPNAIKQPSRQIFTMLE